MDSLYSFRYKMTVWLPVLLIAFAALGIVQFRARAAKVRRTEKRFEQERDLATARLERAIVASSAKTPEQKPEDSAGTRQTGTLAKQTASTDVPGSLIEMTTRSSQFSTSSVEEFHFAVPDGSNK
jgi:hypothetical protein